MMALSFRIFFLLLFLLSLIYIYFLDMYLEAALNIIETLQERYECVIKPKR